MLQGIGCLLQKELWMGVLQDFKQALQRIRDFLTDLLQQGMDGNPVFHIIRYVFGCYL